MTRVVIAATPRHAAQIESLFLNRNPVVDVEGVDKLVRLKALDADECGLDRIPEWLEDVEMLEYLHVRVNLLVELPEWFMSKPSLKGVDCSRNVRMRNVASPGRNLSFLNLSECDVKSLPDDLFFHRLKVVYLKGNRGTWLLECLFISMYVCLFVWVFWAACLLVMNL